MGNTTDKKWVYNFDEVDQAEKLAGSKDELKALLGGKGANLAIMTGLGVPVPPGYTLTTEACNAYLEAGEKFTDGMWEQEQEAHRRLEEQTGKKFGDPKNPLLVSCRSGAKFSMPGMMDTVLNIGLNDEVAEGLATLTEDRRFVFDAYRRLVQMYGTVVMDIDDEPFEKVLGDYREKRGVKNDADLAAEDLEEITNTFKQIYKDKTGTDFPVDPWEQLRLATEAVFKSWNGKRAFDYRNAAKIAHDLGTAVNIVTMVFGNMGNCSSTGVATTRNVSNGEKSYEGDWLINAQGEDVVAGIRETKPIASLETEMPDIYPQFSEICQKLEKHYSEVQDIEFTVERGKLWLLQTRDAKRTAMAAIRIAVDLCEEGVITKEQALLRVEPDHIDFFLHPQFDPNALSAADYIAEGLNVSPGAAVGIIAFDADTTEQWAKEDGKDVIMVRPETKPDDVHGMLAANGILTSKGGRTSHAALVARQFGKPAVVGVSGMEVNTEKKQFTIDGRTFKQGDWVSIDGTTGKVYGGQIDTVIPDWNNPYLLKLLSWADETRRLGVYTNADYPQDAKRAREYGAQGIGLCRTEHMFFETERLPHVQEMIMATNDSDREAAINKLLPHQRSDFEGLFRAMDGCPVIVRLIDPPLHEFLPDRDELLQETIELRTSGKDAAKLAENEKMLNVINGLHEQNPMLGFRGVRLSIIIPAMVKMQVRAIMEAACTCAKEGVKVHPEIMIPLTSHVNELKAIQVDLESVAKEVMKEKGIEVDYMFGTMIEIPRAALTAGEIAEYAQFFSFGTNDLTQTGFGISRDDAESGFLMQYLEKGILPENPFASIDEDGIGRLMALAVEAGRKQRPGMEIGICGEHGGDPKSVAFCNKLNLNYVSCSPFRVPIARLAAAHAAILQKDSCCGCTK